MDGFERGGQVAVGGSGVKSSVGAVLGVTWATVGGQGNGLWLGSRQQRAFFAQAAKRRASRRSSGEGQGRLVRPTGDADGGAWRAPSAVGGARRCVLEYDG